MRMAGKTYVFITLTLFLAFNSALKRVLVVYVELVPYYFYDQLVLHGDICTSYLFIIIIHSIPYFVCNYVLSFYFY